MLRIQGEKKTVDVVSILSAQFGAVPQVKEPTRVTVLEEEKISAYYAGGRLYAEPKRLGPLL
jgi:photosynthetic reaction center H subunit